MFWMLLGSWSGQVCRWVLRVWFWVLWVMFSIWWLWWCMLRVWVIVVGSGPKRWFWVVGSVLVICVQFWGGSVGVCWLWGGQVLFWLSCCWMYLSMWW